MAKETQIKSANHKIVIGQAVKYYWHGKIRYGYVTEIDGKSITVRDTIDF